MGQGKGIHYPVYKYKGAWQAVQSVFRGPLHLKQVASQAR